MIVKPSSSTTLKINADLRLLNVVRFVAWTNLIYFFIEFYYAQQATSVALFADSIDFLEDAAINFLILFAATWSPESRNKLSRVLAGFILIPSGFAFWELIYKFMNHQSSLAEQMAKVGLGALIVNGTCALLLSKYRNDKEAIIKAAVLSSRNDLLGNLGIILAGIVTLKWNSHWPDLVVGAVIFILNASAAKNVWDAGRASY